MLVLFKPDFVILTVTAFICDRRTNQIRFCSRFIGFIQLFQECVKWLTDNTDKMDAVVHNQSEGGNRLVLLPISLLIYRFLVSQLMCACLLACFSENISSKSKEENIKGTLLNRQTSLIWAPVESVPVMLMLVWCWDGYRQWLEGSDKFRWIDEHVLMVSAVD